VLLKAADSSAAAMTAAIKALKQPSDEVMAAGEGCKSAVAAAQRISLPVQR
jgi:hypothetical protein